MLVGFACAVGVDMKFNTGHHAGETTTIHTHADGNKHHHHEKKEQEQHDSKTNCCTDGVVKISQADKDVPQAGKLLNPLFFTAFVVTFYHAGIACASPANAYQPYRTQAHHPPIPDIRIAIQSFQI